jgi:hypothetical protein
MITEDYVSFEIAKLLKEKGFNEPTLAYAYGNNMMNYYSRPRITDIQSIEVGKIPMPTLQMAMKWLREVHNIKVNVFYNNSNYAIEYFEPNTQTGVGKFVFIGDGYKSFEQACEAAIKYCLENLI